MNRTLKVDLDLLDMQILDLNRSLQDMVINHGIWGIYNFITEIADALEDGDEVTLVKGE